MPHLLIIDPQNDFCDLPAAWHGRDPSSGAAIAPALPVPGAHADMQRLARLIDACGERIDDITITLDSHQRLDIAHPAFWRQSDGAPVAPFTSISAAQVRAGTFTPRDAGALPRTLSYLDALQAQGRYQLMVWPVHCEVGSWGHTVHADVLAACGRWQERRQRAVHHVFKGSNPWTEHYSAVEAEVPDPHDRSTALNTELLHQLGQADQLWVAGQASSHCVRATCEHLLQHLPTLVAGWTAAQLTLLVDCTSPVAGFAAQHQQLLNTLQAQGAHLVTSHTCS